MDRVKYIAGGRWQNIIRLVAPWPDAAVLAMIRCTVAGYTPLVENPALASSLRTDISSPGRQLVAPSTSKERVRELFPDGRTSRAIPCSRQARGSPQPQPKKEYPPRERVPVSGGRRDSTR